MSSKIQERILPFRVAAIAPGAANEFSLVNEGPELWVHRLVICGRTTFAFGLVVEGLFCDSPVNLLPPDTGAFIFSESSTMKEWSDVRLPKGRILSVVIRNCGPKACVLSPVVLGSSYE